jgi:hypothetical protein
MQEADFLQVHIRRGLFDIKDSQRLPTEPCIKPRQWVGETAFPLMESAATHRMENFQIMMCCLEGEAIVLREGVAQPASRTYRHHRLGLALSDPWMRDWLKAGCGSAARGLSPLGESEAQQLNRADGRATVLTRTGHKGLALPTS